MNPLITPTPWPTTSAPLPIAPSALTSHFPDAPQLAVQAVGIWNQFIGQAWDTIAGMFVLALVIAAIVSIAYHVSRLGEDA